MEGFYPKYDNDTDHVQGDSWPNRYVDCLSIKETTFRYPNITYYNAIGSRGTDGSAMELVYTGTPAGTYLGRSVNYVPEGVGTGYRDSSTIRQIGLMAELRLDWSATYALCSSQPGAAPYRPVEFYLILDEGKGGGGAAFTTEFAEVMSYDLGSYFSMTRNPDYLGRFRVLKRLEFDTPFWTKDTASNVVQPGAGPGNIAMERFYVDLEGISMSYGAGTTSMVDNVIYGVWFQTNEPTYTGVSPKCYMTTQFYYTKD